MSLGLQLLKWGLRDINLLKPRLRLDPGLYLRFKSKRHGKVVMLLDVYLEIQIEDSFASLLRPLPM